MYPAPTYMNTLQYLLNLVGLQGSQVIEHAKALAGTVNTASLNLPAIQRGSIKFSKRLYMIIYDFYIFKSNLYNKYKVLQGGILSAPMLGSVLVLAQVLNERDVFWGVKGEFCPINLSRG